MIKSILIDLDNTLIHNDDKQFAVEFTHQIRHYGQTQGISDLDVIYRNNIRRVRSETVTDQTIQERFNRYTSEATGLNVEEVSDLYTTFFTTVPLAEFSTPLTGAKEFIAQLFAHGYDIVIATNPMYPRQFAIERMIRGGLESFIERFSYITHTDNMHFLKPAPCYYAELLARIGLEADEVVMIGDRNDNDIHPAEAIGINGYIFQDQTSFKAIFNQIAHEPPPILHLHPAMIFPQYQGNIAGLFGVIKDIKPHFWDQQSIPNEWSPRQIIGHLIDSEINVQRQRILTILQEDNPFLVQPAPPATIDDLTSDGLALAHRWADLRQETIQILGQLSPEDWQRPARHSIFGSTTLLEMAQFTAQHDRLHVKQLCQTVGHCV
jgi:HAD superfamily hydrolase (TIGR01549 family)